MSEEAKKNAKKMGTEVPAKKTPQKKTPQKKTEANKPQNKPQIICAKQHPIKDGLRRLGTAAKEFGKAAADTTKAVLKSKPAKAGGIVAAGMILYKGYKFIKGSDEVDVFEGTDNPVCLDDANDSDCGNENPEE